MVFFCIRPDTGYGKGQVGYRILEEVEYPAKCAVCSVHPARFKFWQGISNLFKNASMQLVMTKNKIEGENFKLDFLYFFFFIKIF